jgi:DNA-binding response OmpR family regulator
MPIRVLLVRYQLQDGYSDDVIAASAELKRIELPKVIVLLAGGTSSTIEARQLNLGADCIQRDPIRSDVLLAYVEKYLHTRTKLRAAPSAKCICFSGAILNPLDRTLQHGSRTVLITPREVTLIELLSESIDEIVTYDSLYNEILGRRFRGDTSNMRVLLAKLTTSARQIGLSLRLAIDVIPKTGYRYRVHDLALPCDCHSGLPEADQP